jgi:hypothetical protein
MLKSLLVWLLLLALPFQGYAAASMLPCAPAHVAASASAMMGGAHHDHSKMLAAQQAGSHHGAEKAPAKHHGNGQCNACSACCPANLMVTSFQLASDTPHFATVPFKTGFMPVVALALPERPPQSLT